MLGYQGPKLDCTVNQLYAGTINDILTDLLKSTRVLHVDVALGDWHILLDLKSSLTDYIQHSMVQV